MSTRKSNLRFQYYPTMLAARNASCADFGTLWDRVGVKEGFVMIYRVTGHMVALVVGEPPISPCLTKHVA